MRIIQAVGKAGLMAGLGLGLVACSSVTGEAVPGAAPPATGAAGVPITPALPVAPVEFTVPTGKIALGPIHFALPSRTSLGTYRRNVDCWVFVRVIRDTDFPGSDEITGVVRKALGAAHLTVLDGSFSTPDQATQADYYLTATIPQAHADLCINNFFNDGPADVEAQVGVNWQLISTRDHRVVFETQTSGSGQGRDDKQGITAGVDAALDNAARQWLQSVSVQQYLTFGRLATPALPPGLAAVAATLGAAPPAPGTAPAAAPTVPVQSPIQAPAPIPGQAPTVALVPVRLLAGGESSPAADRNRLLVAVGDAPGIVIGTDGTILTTAAAVGEGPSVTVALGGATRSARILRRDAGFDLAVLRLDGPPAPAAALDLRRPAAGESLTAAGPAGPVSARYAGPGASLGLSGLPAGTPVFDAAGGLVGVLRADGSLAPIGRIFHDLGLAAAFGAD